MKLSQSSAAMYLSCQRKWKLYASKTDKDPDWRKGKALRFGAAYAECQEEFRDNWKLMTTQKIIRIAERNDLDINDAAKLMACLRTYFANVKEGDVVEKVELTLDHPMLSGRIDKTILRDGKRYIGEDKTASEINPALPTILLTDPQLCVYAECQEQFEADGGIIYRVVSKPKEKRKKEESWEAFTQRCKCEFLELVIPFESLQIKEALGRIQVIADEIDSKVKLEEFPQNFRNCEMFGSGCEYYSRCHGKTFSEAKGMW